MNGYFKTSCPICAQGIEYPKEGVGTDIQCPSCQSWIVLRRDLPTRWLKFWMYFRLPVAFLTSLAALGDVRAMSFSSFFLIAYCGLVASVMSGLIKRKLWGWKWNWVFLSIETLLFPLYILSVLFAGQSLKPGASQSGAAIALLKLYGSLLLVYGSIWLLPNAVYFLKRKHLFK